MFFTISKTISKIIYLFVYIITNIQVSLRTLGRLVSSTGCVVEPYLQYPDLMPRILGLMQEGGNIPWSLKQEVLRTLGLLGALDPYKLDAVMASQDSNSDNNTGVTTTPLLALENMDNRGSSSVGSNSRKSYMGNSLHRSITGTGTGHDGAGKVSRRQKVEDMPAAGVMFEQSAMVAMPSMKQEVERLTPTLDDYYPKVAVRCASSSLSHIYNYV